MKFVRVINPIPFNDCIYLKDTYICAEESVLAPFVDKGDAEWCDDPTPPEPIEVPAP